MFSGGEWYFSFINILITGSYGFILLTASHKVSRNYSLYLHNEQLVINNTMWGIMVISLADISHVEVGRWKKKDLVNELMLGYGQYSNIKLSLNLENSYYTNMGHSTEMTQEVYLQVEKPEEFKSTLSKATEL